MFERGREWSSEEKERKRRPFSSSSRLRRFRVMGQLPSSTQQENKGDGPQLRSSDGLTTTVDNRSAHRGERSQRRAGGDEETGGESGTPGLRSLFARLGRCQESFPKLGSSDGERAARSEGREKRTCEGRAATKRWSSIVHPTSLPALEGQQAHERRNAPFYYPSEHPCRPLRLPRLLGRPNPPCHPVRDAAEVSLMVRSVQVGLEKDVRAEESGGGRLRTVEVSRSRSSHFWPEGEDVRDPRGTAARSRRCSIPTYARATKPPCCLRR